MQPNQQQNDAPRTAGDQHRGDSPDLLFAVPDYLGLEPIKEAPKKGRIFKRAVLFLTPIFLVAGSGAAALLWWQQSDPEEIFYKALENSMQTKYVKREYNYQSAQPKSTLKIEAYTDLSDAARPKSKIAYSYNNSDGGSNNNGEQYNGEIRVTNNTDFFASLSTVPAGTLPKDAVLGEIYKIANPDTSTETTTAATFDSLKLRYLVNTTYGTIPLGSFTQTQVNELLGVIIANDVYTLKSVTDEVLGAIRTKKYTVKINYPELTKTLQKIAELLNIDESNILFAGSPDDITVWIDPTLSRIIKTDQKSSNNQPRFVEIKYEYPENLSVEEPKNAEQLP